jgi:hypothetical protein
MSIPTRRQFLNVLAGSAAAAALAPAGLGQAGARSGSAPRLRAIVHRGMFIDACPLPGETRADGSVPAHPNGIQVARDLYLVLYATRGFRGTDDDRSICYQLRRSSFAGPLLAEGFLSRSVDDWQPDGDGKKYFKQHGHPVAFGVPKGAILGGRVPAHAGVFVAKWRTRGVNFVDGHVDPPGSRVGQGVEWVQFRLNAGETDIEIIEPLARLRQVGYERGPLICPLPNYGWMNQTYVNAVPFNADADQWVDANHFDRNRVAPLRYAFNPRRGRYEWVQTGNYLIDPKGGIWEGSVVRWGSDWLVCTRLGNAVDEPGRPKRGNRGIGWLRTKDLFNGEGEIAFPPRPSPQAARSAYCCADGVLRVFGGDDSVPLTNRKPRSRRNPVYAWDIDPDRGWAASEPREVFDAWRLQADLRPKSVPMCDMIKLLPPTGNVQTLLHRVTYTPANGPLTAAEFATCGIYRAELHYDGDIAPLWRFG